MSSLAEMVVEHALFLATAPDSVLDPDVAVAQLEWITVAARELSPDDRALLGEALRRRAASSDAPMRGELKGLAEDFGLPSVAG